MLTQFDTHKYWALRIVLFMRRGFLCNLWEEKQAVAMVDVALPCDSGLSVTSLQTITKKSQMVLISNVKSIFKLPSCPQVDSISL